MSLTNADRDRLAYSLGVMDQSGLAMGYPDLVRMLNRIFTDKVAKLPWVPTSWLGAVGEVQSKNPTDLIKVTPGFDALNRRGQLAPSFADTDDKLKVWHTIYKAQQDAIVEYAAKQSEIGANRLRALEADAAFWDGAYKLAKIARDLPSNVVKAVGGGVSDFVGTFLPESLKAYAKWVLLAIVLLVVGGVVLWYRKKLGGLIKGFKGGK